MGRNILFIGGPVDSLFSLARAKSLNFGVYCVDGLATAPGLVWSRYQGLDGAVADVYRPDLILKEVARNGWVVDGVLAIGTDVGPVVAEVAEALSLPTIPRQTCLLSWNKPALKERLRQAGIPTPGDSCDFVVKPVDGRGSRGVYVLAASGMSNPFIIDAVQQSPSGRVMFERYIPGPGISAEAVVWNGAVVWAGFTDRYYTHSLTVESGGAGPSVWDGQACRVTVQQAVNALGVRAGTIKLDLILDEDNCHRPTIIEAAINRIGGGNNPLYWSLCYGVDFVLMACQVATGQEPTPIPFKRPYPLYLTGRYEMPGNPERNNQRGRFHLSLGRSREEAERKAGEWVAKVNSK